MQIRFPLFLTCILILSALVTPINANEYETKGIYLKIAVQLYSYANFQEALNDEKNINWDTDFEKANAITGAYAAFELKKHYELLGKNATISNYNKNKVDKSIVLLLKESFSSNHPVAASQVNYETLGDQGFSIVPYKRTLFVTANTRIGLLYGSYEVLKKIGFEWYNPDETIVPKKGNVKKIHIESSKSPFINLRGFWTFSEDYLSEKRVVWLARNRFNIAGKVAPYLAKKLGIKIWGGEHNLIQEEFSRPGLFEKHPEWYALYKNERLPVNSKGNYTNPSYANVEAAEYFAKKILFRLTKGDLAHVDILNVWPADRRNGRLDQSEIAKAAGNFSDTLLSFYGVLAQHLKSAYEEGTLKRRVILAGISYHLTLEAPSNTAMIKKLEELDYIHIFYPSTRDWSYPINKNLEQSDINKKLHDSFNEWQKKTNFEYGVVAYNNKSNYSAIALTDHLNFAENLDFYFPQKGGLYSYMHAIKENPGPLQLTNALISEFGWKGPNEPSKMKAKLIIEKYFKNRYGKFAKKWNEIYDEMSLSVSNAKSIFEAESLSSFLFQNVYWAKPRFSQEEAISFIPKYLKGGFQKIPNGIYYDKEATYKANFIGLEESIGIHLRLEPIWKALIEQVNEDEIKKRMQEDIVWFEATKHRYNLMALCCDFVKAESKNHETSDLKKRIEKEILYLENTSVTNDLISPVNQRAFLEIIKKRINLVKE
ncbi:DUF4838 domain-containing protein [Maribacter sp. 2308TA10-17]|uniref:DUF4838 domain-containing protein n=1 Tax=Maribacter sp. 2308TA10-17 TaxID=3386276 RepID=UPI0039BD8DA8